MARVEALFKCKKCLDEFTAISGQMTKCNCGACELEPKRYGTSYISNDGKHFEQLETKIYYLEKDYFIMDDEIQNLWNRIKDISDYKHEIVDKGADGIIFINTLTAEVTSHNNFNEYNTAKFRTYLDERVDRNKLKSRMLKYIDVVEKIRNKEISLNDRDAMDDLCYSREKQQHDYYDYTFYF